MVHSPPRSDRAKTAIWRDDNDIRVLVKGATVATNGNVAVIDRICRFHLLISAAPAYAGTMRVTSEFFIAVLIRRVFSSGGFAAVERKGAAEAGAIFVRQRFRDGLETLYAPAPQSLFDEGRPDDRRFEIRLQKAEPDAVGVIIAREAKFDPDLWVVELEVDEIGDLIGVA